MLKKPIRCGSGHAAGRVRRILAALILPTLAACQGTVPLEEATPIVKPDMELPVSQRVHKAIQALQVGDKESARNQLIWALQEKPSQKVAKHLLEQLDADPIEYLGKEHFSYRISAGDSLSIIARDFLNDALKFVILARYNEIENPSELETGQLIKIPGKKRNALPDRDHQENTAKLETITGPEESAEEEPFTQTGVNPVQENTLQPESPEKISQTANELHASGDLHGAITLLERTGTHTLKSKPLRDQLISYYSEWADNAMANGKMQDARTILKKAITLDSSNKRVADKLNTVEEKIEAQRLFQQGQKLLKEEQLPRAYEAFSQALVHDPSNSAISSAQNQTRDELTDRYHRQALQLFRQHKLDEAIEYWDKILAIDPKHSLAPGYRARAVELNSKLRKIAQ